MPKSVHHQHSYLELGDETKSSVRAPLCLVSRLFPGSVSMDAIKIIIQYSYRTQPTLKLAASLLVQRASRTDLIRILMAWYLSGVHIVVFVLHAATVLVLDKIGTKNRIILPILWLKEKHPIWAPEKCKKRKKEKKNLRKKKHHPQSDHSFNYW